MDYYCSGYIDYFNLFIGDGAMGKVRIFMNQVKSARKCTFCRHWYDPTNSNLNMLAGGALEYDSSAVRRCTVKFGKEMPAACCCNRFESKM